MNDSRLKLIAHRGNTTGPDPSSENTPAAIDHCIDMGYDVEIDLWYHDGDLYLGHDEPTIPITIDYLLPHKDKLWIHCKNLQACTRLHNLRNFNYFFNEEDNYALTSERFVWTYPRPQNVYAWNQVMLDFGSDVDFKKYELLGVYGVCADYLPIIKKS